MIGANLITRIKRREHEAFEELYDTCFTSLCRYAMRYVYDWSTAEDIVQEAFYSFWIKIDQFDVDKEPFPYLLVLVKNQCLNFIRDLKIHDSHNDKIIESMVFSAIEDSEIEPDVKKRLDLIMSKVSDKQREVLMKHVIERKTLNDIAQEMGVTSETVKTHYKRVLKIIRNNFMFIVTGFC